MGWDAVFLGGGLGSAGSWIAYRDDTDSVVHVFEAQVFQRRVDADGAAADHSHSDDVAHPRYPFF